MDGIVTEMGHFTGPRISSRCFRPTKECRTHCWKRWRLVLPSIITSIPGSIDLVRDGEEGVVVDGSLPSVTDALSQYIGSSQLQAEHGAAAQVRALSHFSARSILDRHIRMYQRVMAGDAAEG